MQGFVRAKICPDACKRGLIYKSTENSSLRRAAQFNRHLKNNYYYVIQCSRENSVEASYDINYTRGGLHTSTSKLGFSMNLV